MRNPRDVLQAAEAVEQLSEQSLTAVAEAKGLTVQQLRARLDGKLLELAEGGDVQAIAMLSERVAGVSLGRIERRRSATTDVLRRHRSGLGSTTRTGSAASTTAPAALPRGPTV